VDETLKRRLIGAAVVVSLAVIFVPMLVEEAPVPDPRIEGSNVPPREDLTFKSSLLKDEVVPTDAAPPNGAAHEAVAPPVAVAPAPDVKPAVAAAPEAEAAAPAAEAASEAMPPKEAARPVETSPAPRSPATAPPASGQVAKATPTQPTKPIPKLTAWVVQVGNYSSRDKADAVAQPLRAKGLETFVEPMDEGGKVIYRVSVGPESDRRRVEALLPRVEAAMGGKDKPFIRSYP
jgi:DedD protein